jgi:hypothetical protein
MERIAEHCWPILTDQTSGGVQVDKRISNQVRSTIVQLAEAAAHC